MAFLTSLNPGGPSLLSKRHLNYLRQPVMSRHKVQGQEYSHSSAQCLTASVAALKLKSHEETFRTDNITQGTCIPFYRPLDLINIIPSSTRTDFHPVGLSESIGSRYNESHEETFQTDNIGLTQGIFIPSDRSYITPSSTRTVCYPVGLESTGSRYNESHEKTFQTDNITQGTCIPSDRPLYLTPSCTRTDFHPVGLSESTGSRYNESHEETFQTDNITQGTCIPSDRSLELTPSSTRTDFHPVGLSESISSRYNENLTTVSSLQIRQNKAFRHLLDQHSTTALKKRCSATSSSDGLIIAILFAIMIIIFGILAFGLLVLVLKPKPERPCEIFDSIEHVPDHGQYDPIREWGRACGSVHIANLDNDAETSQRQKL